MSERDHSNGLAVRQDSARYLQWGTAAPTQPLVNPPAAPLSTARSFTSNQQPPGEQPDDGRNYYTEYSQVSAIETGFKKLKTNQIQILKELKKEYQVLKNSTLEVREVARPPTSSESQSNFDGRSVTNSEVQSSLRSRARSHRQDARQLHMADLEKKQLEMMLANSMKKIQQLLHNEIELKKSVVDLKARLEDTKTSESEVQILKRKNKQGEEAMGRALDDSRRENDSLRSRLKELTVTLGSAEGSLSVKEAQLRKKDQKIRLLEEQVALERSKQVSAELDLKKLTMEYDLLQKSKSEEIAILEKAKHSLEQTQNASTNVVIRRLQEELAVREERYNMLLQKIDKQHLDSQGQLEQERGLEKLMHAIRQEKTSQNNEQLTLLLNRLTEMQATQSKPDAALTSELHSLRKELEDLRSEQAQKSGYDKDARIRELERIMEEQNIEKNYFMEDIQRTNREMSELKSEREGLRREVQDLRSEKDRLEFDNKRYRNQLETIRNTSVDLTDSQHNNKNLQTKLQHFNMKELESGQIREELNKQLDLLRGREAKVQQELREVKRQAAEADFQLYKVKQEYELKLSLQRKEHLAQVKRLQEDIERAQATASADKGELTAKRVQLEGKLLERTRQVEEYELRLRGLEGNAQKVGASYHESQQLRLKQLSDRHTEQVQRLVARIQSLSQANANFAQHSARQAQVESELMILRQHMRSNRHMTEGVDHLWQIKEAEYGNVDDILRSLEQGD